MKWSANMSDELHDVYQALSEAQQNNRPVTLVTVIETQGSIPRHAGSKMLVYPDGSIVGTIGGGLMESQVIEEALLAQKETTPRIRQYTLNDFDSGNVGICGGTAKMFIEPIGIASTLLVIGGGHVGKALAELGKWAGYRVALSDDREAFCNPTYLAGLDDYVVCPPAEVPEHAMINAQTYIAAVTRGLPVDRRLIPALLRTDAAYIGLIGSRRRWHLTKAALIDEGVTESELARVHAPIGLELQAETPKEIALSILAEIVMLQRGGTGAPMHLPDNRENN